MMNSNLLGKIGILGVATLLTLPALGCETKAGEEAGDSTETSGDGDGDPATGDGDGDPTTGDGDGDPTTGDGDGDPTTGDGDGDMPPDCSTTHVEGDGVAEGEDCSVNEDCASRVCEVYEDAPPGKGACAPIPADCETRIMGTVFDFVSREPLASGNLRVAPALFASLDPVGVEAVATATSDDMGIIDTLSEGQIEAAIGIVGLVDATDQYLTVTGLASPLDGSFYGPANTIHEIWSMPAGTLADWSGYLEPDPEFVNFLPLGETGGVIGYVRDVNGDPVAGAVVEPTDPDGSSAKIRYLNDSGDGFEEDMTASSGIFVLADPGLGETFDVLIGGESQGLDGRAGSANLAIFTLIMTVP